jgi:hypothetical protein
MKHPVKFFTPFDLRVSIETDKECELYVDNDMNSGSNSLKVFWQIEPNDVSGLRDTIINNHSQYDLILCWDEEILKKCDNSKLYPFGTCWIRDYNFDLPKKFSVSSLIGNKSLSENHNIRYQLINLPSEVKNIEFELYNSRNNSRNIPNLKTIEDTVYKDEIFYNQFHICIENFSYTNWFTEKIIDCFRTKTIPIYMGCPNIGDFFDINGIIVVNSYEEIVEKCKNLDESTYESMKESIEKNYLLSEKYAFFRETLKKEIINFCQIN